MPRKKAAAPLVTVNFNDEIHKRLSQLESDVEELAARNTATLVELRDAWAAIREINFKLNQARKAGGDAT